MKKEITEDDWAVFKFGIIACALNNSFTCTKEELFDTLSKNEYITPNGDKKMYSKPTLKKWCSEYKKHGLDALKPNKRSDIGKSKTITPEAFAYIAERKKNSPKIPAQQLYEELISNGICTRLDTSVSSITRFLQANDLTKSKLSPVVRLAFEMEYSNQLWQGDSSFSVILTIGGKKRQTYLVALIDDASRIIPYAEFFYEDNSLNVQKVVKLAIEKKGVPQKLYFDNRVSL